MKFESLPLLNLKSSQNIYDKTVSFFAPIHKKLVKIDILGALDI